jgi:hypothetical protein
MASNYKMVNFPHLISPHNTWHKHFESLKEMQDLLDLLDLF